jgi:hypothetical protein
MDLFEFAMHLLTTQKIVTEKSDVLINITESEIDRLTTRLFAPFKIPKSKEYGIPEHLELEGRLGTLQTVETADSHRVQFESSIDPLTVPEDNVFEHLRRWLMETLPTDTKMEIRNVLTDQMMPVVYECKSVKHWSRKSATKDRANGVTRLELSRIARCQQCTQPVKRRKTDASDPITSNKEACTLCVSGHILDWSKCTKRDVMNPSHLDIGMRQLAYSLHYDYRISVHEEHVKTIQIPEVMEWCKDAKGRIQTTPEDVAHVSKDGTMVRMSHSDVVLREKACQYRIGLGAWWIDLSPVTTYVDVMPLEYCDESILARKRGLPQEIPEQYNAFIAKQHCELEFELNVKSLFAEGSSLPYRISFDKCKEIVAELLILLNMFNYVTSYLKVHKFVLSSNKP